MNPLHILVIDDNQLAAQMIRLLLVRFGYEMTQKTNLTKTLNWLHIPGNLLDLIISDIIMPQVSGHEFIRHVRSDPLAVRLPIILLTGSRRRRPHCEAVQ